MYNFRNWVKGTNQSSSKGSIQRKKNLFFNIPRLEGLEKREVMAAPVLNPAISVALVESNKNPGDPVGAVGNLISDVIISSGVNQNYTDADSDPAGIAIVGKNSNGTLWYSTNDGNTWVKVTQTLSDSNALLIKADAGRRLYFEPTNNFTGAVSDAVTFRAWDQTGGVNEGTFNSVVGTASLSSLIAPSNFFTIYNSVAYDGDYAYLAGAANDGPHGAALRKIDLRTNQSSIVWYQSGASNTNGAAYDIKIDGNYAYIAVNAQTLNSNSGGLYIVNITTGAQVSRTSVETVGSLTDQLQTINLKTINGTLYAFVGTAGSGLHVYNVSNPASPVKVCTLASTYTSSLIDDERFVTGAIYGNYLYITVGLPGALRIYDISNPASTNLVNTVTFGNNVSGGFVLIEGNKLFVATAVYDRNALPANVPKNKYTYSINGYDLTNPASPALVGSVVIPDHTAYGSMVVRNSKLLVFSSDFFGYIQGSYLDYLTTIDFSSGFTNESEAQIGSNLGLYVGPAGLYNNEVFLPATISNGQHGLVKFIAPGPVAYVSTASDVASQQVTYFNIAPSVTGFTGSSSLSYTENTFGTTLFTPGNPSGVNTPEVAQTITQMVFTISGLLDGNDEKLYFDNTNVALTDANSGTTTSNGMSYSVAVSAGVATVTFNKVAGVSSSVAKTILANVGYLNSSENPTSGNRVITLTLVKDNGGTVIDAGNGISSQVSVDSVVPLINGSAFTSTISMVQLNDAPIINGGANLATIMEDITTGANVGATVASILAQGSVSVSDAENDPLGIAVEATAGSGIWEFSTDNGANWVAIGSVSSSSALLLDGNAKVRYTPGVDDGVSPQIVFRAWDGTSGTASTNANPSKVSVIPNGGTTAFSFLNATLGITVDYYPEVNSIVAGVDPIILGLNTNPTATPSPIDFYLSELVSISPSSVTILQTDKNGDPINTPNFLGTLGAVTYIGTTAQGENYRATFTPAPNVEGTVSFKILAGAVADLDGTPNPSITNSPTITVGVDTIRPTISSITSTTADGLYKLNSVINVTANISEQVRQGATFTVTLDTGRQVVLTAASAGTTLTGSYTVQAGDLSPDLTVTATNSPTVLDILGNAMANPNPSPGAGILPASPNNLGNIKNIEVDGVTPNAATNLVLTSVGGNIVANTLNSTNTNLTATATITAGDATNGRAELVLIRIVSGSLVETLLATDISIAAGDNSVTFDLGKTTVADLQAAITSGGTVKVRLLDEATNDSPLSAGVSLTVDYIVPTVNISTSRTPVLAGQTATITFLFSENVNGFDNTKIIQTGGAGTLATLTGNNPSYSATFTPTVSFEGSENFSVGFDAARDDAGNPLTASSVLNVPVDTINPTIISITSTTSDGLYGVGKQINITATTSEPVSAGSSIVINLNSGGQVTITAPTNGTTLAGTYVVGVNDDALDLNPSSYTSLNVFDILGNPLVPPVIIPTGQNLGDLKNIKIDGIYPGAPTANTITDDTNIVTDQVTRDNTLTFTGTAEPNSVVKLIAISSVFGNNNAPVELKSVVADANGSYTFTTSDMTVGNTAYPVLLDGTYTFSITSTDAAENTTTTQVGPWVIDTIAPNTPVETTSNPGNLLTTGTAEAFAKIHYTLAGVDYVTFADNAGAWSIDLRTAVPANGVAPAFPGGPYSVAITAMDLAGNISVPTAPAQRTITQVIFGNPALTSSTVVAVASPVISGIAPANSTVTVTIGARNAVTTATAIGTWSIDLAAENPAITLSLSNQGANPISLQATLGTNSSNGSALLVYNNAVPSNPVINPLNVNPLFTNSRTPVITGTADPFSKVVLSINRNGSTVVTTYGAQTDGAGNWKITFGVDLPRTGVLSQLSDATYDLSAVSYNLAGTASAGIATKALVVDLLAPNTPDFTSPAFSRLNSPIITGTGDAGTYLHLRMGGIEFPVVQITNPGGTWSVNTSPSTFPVGIYEVTIYGTDDAGNQTPSRKQYLQIDTVAPANPLITSPDKTRDTTPVIFGTAEPDAELTVVLTDSNNANALIGTYVVISNSNGLWTLDTQTLIPQGATNPISPLTTSLIGVSATAKDRAGNVSGATTQALAIDANAPDAPVFTSPAFTNDTTPTVTGTAVPNSVVTLYNGITPLSPTVTANAQGAWTYTFATPVTPGVINLAATATVGANTSGKVLQNLTVDTTAPVINSVTPSFGLVLNAAETSQPANIVVAISGIEDGRPVTIALNGVNYTGTVFAGLANIIIPSSALLALTDGTTQVLLADATDAAGNPATQISTSFDVDRTPPNRPFFGNISSSGSDVTPDDAFTTVTTPVVVIRGEPGNTIVVRGPDGLVSPTLYTVNDNQGSYTVTFNNSVVLPDGEYFVNLKDSNDNESLNTTGPRSQNYFKINGISVLYDQPEVRSTSQGKTYGNLGAFGTLAGVRTFVKQQANGNWIDLDGETLTFGIVGGSPANSNVTEFTTSDGASLSLNVITGAYIYTPVPGSNRIDKFLIFAVDTPTGNQTRLNLNFNSLDTLDRDGISGSSESILASSVAGNDGDLNNDGKQDSLQNAVSTLAWRRRSDFLTGTNPSTVNQTARESIITMVVNSGSSSDSSLGGLTTNVEDLAQFYDITVENNLPSPRATDFGIRNQPWDVLNFTVESLTGTNFDDLDPTRDGVQIKVTIDVSTANITFGPNGLNAYRKHVNQATIDNYREAGLPLVNLDGTPVTTAGWYDYTQRVAGGDGAKFFDFDNDGKLEAIVLTFTDNAFGDDNPVSNIVVDPGTPVGFSSSGNGYGSGPGASLGPVAPIAPNTTATVVMPFITTGGVLPSNVSLSGAVAGTQVNLYSDLQGTIAATVTPYANFFGEVRIARGNTNGGAVGEIITAPGLGGGPHIKVIDSATGAVNAEFMAYDPSFTGGVFVASADFNRDGRDEIVTAAGAGGASHIKIFDGITKQEIASFFAYDPSFRGGVSIAAFDVNNDGTVDLVTGAGFGGGPEVKVFSGVDFSLIKSFFAYAIDFTGGVFVAAGDLLSDGTYEIVTGAGEGGGAHVKVWDYDTLTIENQFYAYNKFTLEDGNVIDQIFGGGVRVGIADTNNDGVNDLVTGAGPGGGPHVKVFSGFNLDLISNFFATDKKDGRGIFVS